MNHPLPAQTLEESDSDPVATIQSTIYWRVCSGLADSVQLLAIGVLLDFLLFDGMRIGVPIRLLAVALILVGVARSSGGLILLAIQASLFLREPSNPEMPLGMDAFFFCTLSLAVIATTYCSQRIRRNISCWFAAQLCQASPGAMDLESNRSSATAWWKQGLEFASFGLYLSASAFSAMLLLSHLPVSARVLQQWLRRSISDGYTFWPGATIIVLCVAAGVLLSEFSWRQMTRAQSRLYLRSIGMTLHHRDLRMIVRRHLRKRRKGAKDGMVA